MRNVLIASLLTAGALSAWSLSWVVHPVQMVGAVVLIATCSGAVVLLMRDSAPRITYWQRMDGAMLDRDDRWRCYECGVEFTADGRNWPYRLTEPHRRANPQCRALNFERVTAPPPSSSTCVTG